MREYELVIDEAFKNGLCPLEKPPINSQFLKEALGLKCKDGELVVAVEGTNPLPSSLSIDYIWPFPQFFKGEGYNILAFKDVSDNIKVYMVSDDFQTVTLLATIWPVLHESSILEVADFAEYIFMTTGSGMIYWDAESGVWQRIAESTTIPTMRTVCNFKGQAVGGCVISSWYDCDETFYIWSQIGSMDFTIGNDNEAGYRRCPYGGTVYHTRRLGDLVLGYSSKGITALVPSSSQTPEFGTGATFGFRELSDIGVLNRGAVGGNLQKQIYVGVDYILREVTSEGVKELGYKTYMKQLTGDVVINYDEDEGDFYIGDSNKTFLLSKQGMTEILQHPSTVWKKNDNLYMLPSSVDSDNPLICTLPFDMGYRGEKTTFVVETDMEDYENGLVGVDWSLSKDWNEAGFFNSLNDLGIGTNITAGNRLRFRLKFDSLGEDAKISYIKVRYKMTDMRGIRGVYAPPPRGQ